MCEDVYESNPLIPTSSVVFQSVQICKDIELEMFAHHTTPLDQRSDKIADVQNQFVAATNMKLKEDGGKNSEVQSNVQSPKLKGNENNSDLNFQEHMVSNCDETSFIISTEVTRNHCANSIHSQVKSSAKILQNKTHCSSMHNSCHVLIDHCDDLHANKLHHFQLITQAELFAKISPTNYLINLLILIKCLRMFL